MELNDIKKIVRESFQEIKESDLIAKKGNKTWAEHKKEFKDNIEELLIHIEDDKYEDAENVIGKTINILKDWKKRIKEGGSKGDVIDEEK